MPATHRYGDHPDQLADLYLPPGAGPHPVVVLVHGGFWRAVYDRSTTIGLAESAVAHGWAAWNVEYRRLGTGGGVPATLDDVLAAYDALPRLPAPLDFSRVVVVGHSAGGHLALWLATRRRPALVVSLAGVADLAEAARLHIGTDAVAELCGGRPEDRPEAYAAADPIPRLPIGVPQLLVHGDVDDRVPVELSRRWASRAVQAGDRCELRELPGVDHFALIDPAGEAWQLVLERLPTS